VIGVRDLVKRTDRNVCPRSDDLHVIIIIGLNCLNTRCSLILQWSTDVILTSVDHPHSCCLPLHYPMGAVNFVRYFRLRAETEALSQTKAMTKFCMLCILDFF